jgi:hypothetical protein
MIRSLSTITIVGVYSINMVSCVYLVKRLEVEALIGQSRGVNCVNESVDLYDNGRKSGVVWVSQRESVVTQVEIRLVYIYLY